MSNVRHLQGVSTEGLDVLFLVPKTLTALGLFPHVLVHISSAHKGFLEKNLMKGGLTPFPRQSFFSLGSGFNFKVSVGVQGRGFQLMKSTSRAL